MVAGPQATSRAAAANRASSDNTGVPRSAQMTPSNPRPLIAPKWTLTNGKHLPSRSTKRRSMDSMRKTALVAGVLYVITYISSIAGPSYSTPC
jgi:hypothetical protein